MMNRIILLSLLAAAVTTGAGCNGTKENPVNTEAVAEQIRQADLALLQAEGRRDLDGVMLLMAPGAVFQPPGFEPIVGLEAIRQFYDTQWFKIPFTEISGTPEAIVVADSGDMAYFDGRSELVFDVAGERKASVGKYLGVWRNIEGKWKLAAISWSGNEQVR